jgi:ABC-2 type transport system ATP-binding protein
MGSADRSAALLAGVRKRYGEVVALDGLDLELRSGEVLGRVGYMAQADALFEDLDARSNLAYFAALQGMPRAEAARRTGELLEYMDLAADSRRSVRGFSGGMR